MAKDPFIGVDIRLINGDIGHSTIGDLELVGNVDPMDNMRQALNMRLTTPLGKYYFAQGYGTRSGNYVDEPNTEYTRNNLEAEARATILEEQRIDKVESIVVSSPSTNQMALSYSAITKTGTRLTDTVQIGGRLN